MSLENKKFIKLGPEESAALVLDTKVKEFFFRHRFKLRTLNGRGIQSFKDYPISQFKKFDVFLAFVKNKPKYPDQIVLKTTPGIKRKNYDTKNN